MKKFAVVLAGCGVYDGAEIHEAILAMLAIKRQGGEYQCFAPDIPQHHVINHLTGEEANEQRNVLVESARIARGEIKSLSDYKVEDYDALIFPGGFGAAKNLSTVAFDGANAKVNPEVKRVVEETHQAKKPIGALCITPAFIAKIIEGVNVTVGDDEGTIKAIEKMAGKHVKTTHGDVVVDEDNMVFTTPCYMLDAQITDIDDGTSNIVAEMMKYMK